MVKVCVRWAVLVSISATVLVIKELVVRPLMALFPDDGRRRRVSMALLLSLASLLLGSDFLLVLGNKSLFVGEQLLEAQFGVRLRHLVLQVVIGERA